MWDQESSILYPHSQTATMRLSRISGPTVPKASMVQCELCPSQRTQHYGEELDDLVFEAIGDDNGNNVKRRSKMPFPKVGTNIIYTHVNRHTDNEISEKE